MNILQLSSYYYPSVGGVEQYVKGISEALSKEHEITVFSQAIETRSSKETLNHVKIVRFWSPLRLRRSYVTTQLLPPLLKGNWDVVHLHVHFPWAESLLLPLVSMRRISLVVTVHNFFSNHRGIRFFENSVTKRLLKKAHSIITTTEEYALCLNKVLGREVKVLPYFIDSKQFKHLENADLKKYQPYLLTVASLEKYHYYKGVDILLKSFLRIRASFPNLNLLVIGEGDLKEKYFTWVKKHNLEPAVHFLGYRPQEELPLFYSMAEGFVLPSLHTESFGLVLIEAQACGTPIICSDLVGVRGLNPHQELICKPGDEESLVGCLNALLQKRDYKEMALKRSAIIGAKYAKERHISELKLVYQTVAR